MDESKRECGRAITNARRQGVDVCVLSDGGAARIAAQISTTPGPPAVRRFGPERLVAEKSTAYSHLY